ncbi:MAG: CDP-diacylglycerol--glycerol-3-phosphate 3-phosphatidyltransferase [Alphaproteobacteria bacterium]
MIFHILMNLANILTFSRILIVIPFVVTFYIHSPWASWLGISLYWIACLTDYFDGVVARKKNQISNLGKFLDPVADKLLISTTLIMLAGTGTLTGLSLIPAIIVLGRELFVSGLREHLFEQKTQISVSGLAKWKTAVQMLSLSFLLVQAPEWVLEIGMALLWVSAALSAITAYQYWIKVKI